MISSLRTHSSLDWIPYEVKAASISQERRIEESQLKQLKIRLYNKMQETEDGPEAA
jgi:hypothetical protein